MASCAHSMSSRYLRAVCQRSARASVVSERPVSRPHRCSALCLVHSAASSRPRRSFASAAFASQSAASRNPLPASSSTHTRSPRIGDDSFHPADPEVEGYKTRLTVERRVHKALTSLPKLADNSALAAVRPPMDNVRIDWWPLGHDDPLASLTLDSLDVDSLDKVELLTAVEKEFDVEFSDEQYEHFTTVGDVIETLLWNPKTK